MKILTDLGIRKQKKYERFSDFLQREVYTDNGIYSFDRHQVFRQIVEDIDNVFLKNQEDVELSNLKGAQIGASTIGIGTSMYIPSQSGLDVGYFLPTDKFAERFDQTRFTPAIRKNTYLQELMREGKFKGANHKGLKEFRGHFLYTLGLFDIKNAISIPLDCNLYDEVDILPEENMEWSYDRIAASDIRFRYNFSVGMMPGLGIDAKYQDGCQYVWNVKCPACGKDNQVLEDLFPACIRKVNDRWERVCIRCGKPYDVETAGRWVAQYPNRIKEGKLSYRLPQLIVPAISLSYIMDQWDKATKKKSRKAKFNCSTLAKPDGGDMQPITEMVLNFNRGEHSLCYFRSANPVFAGVDCGDMAHFAAYERLTDSRKKWIWFEELDSDEMVQRIEELWTKLGITSLVCDSKPLRTEARRIAYAHPRKVWLQDFSGTELQEETAEHQGKQFQRVTVDRDDSLEEFCDLFLNEAQPIMLLPTKGAEYPPILDTVDVHLKNLRKEKILDAKGNTIYRFLKGVANHFGMAMNSATIAEYLSIGKTLLAGPVEYQSVKHRRMRQKGAY